VTSPARPYALATVVRVDPPVSSRVGDKAVVSTDGVLEGWVGGACSEPIVIREALAALAERRPRLVRITPAEMAAAEPSPSAAGVVSVTSTCPSGGGLDVFVEPVGTAPRMLLVGAGPVSATLARLAEALGHEVVTLGHADLDAVGAGAAGPDDAVVVASMGHYDEEALAAALRTRAGYVGMVGSRRRAAAVFGALRGQGVAAADLDRVHSPAGLDLGPSTQEEIALAILAEVVAERHARAAAPAAVAAPVEQSQDPVCGMTVAVAGARLSAEHAGRVWYFCGEHCLHAFGRDPDRYAGAA
jgi:xanthine dehydrogenase accessory factor